MRILEVIQSLGSGGAERLVVDLCNEMVKTQDVYLLILKEAEHFYLPQVSHSVHVIQAHIPIGKNIKQFNTCYRLIKELNPDVVHFHSHARYTILPANIALHGHIKFYMTIHSDVKDSYSKGFSGLQVLLSGFLGRTKFITISPTNYQQFKEIYPRFPQIMIKNGRWFPKNKEISNEVKKEVSTYRANENTLVFIHVARCAEVKNQLLLIKSFNRIIDEGNNATLLVLGSGFDSERGKMITSLACSRIHFLGVKENVYDYLLLSDFFLLSSLVEGMPMSIIEALLAGIPVISTPVCGAIDAIEDGCNGVISSDYSIESYSDAIRKGICNYKELKNNALTQSSDSSWGIKYCTEQYLRWFMQ